MGADPQNHKFDAAIANATNESKHAIMPLLAYALLILNNMSYSEENREDLTRAAVKEVVKRTIKQIEIDKNISWLASQAGSLEQKTFSERCELVLEKSYPPPHLSEGR